MVYPGQTVHGSVFLPIYGPEAKVSLYVREGHTGEIWQSPAECVQKGGWTTLEYKIPPLEGGRIDEMGFCFHMGGVHHPKLTFTGFIDDLYADGEAEYSIEFAGEKEEEWTVLHREVSQFTRWKGLSFLEDGNLHVSCGDCGEVYTGGHDWKDYEARFVITPAAGEYHLVNVHVQGARRSYAAGLLPDGRAGILKNQGGYRLLQEKRVPPGNQERVCDHSKCGTGKDLCGYQRGTENGCDRFRQSLDERRDRSFRKEGKPSSVQQDTGDRKRCNLHKKVIKEPEKFTKMK